MDENDSGVNLTNPQRNNISNNNNQNNRGGNNASNRNRNLSTSSSIKKAYIREMVKILKERDEDNQKFKSTVFYLLIILFSLTIYLLGIFFKQILFTN